MPPQPPKDRMSHKARKQLRRRYAYYLNKRMPLGEIFKLLGRKSMEYIYKVCREFGVPTPKDYMAKRGVYLVISHLFTRRSLQQIADLTGLSRSRIQRVYQMCLDTKIPVPIRNPGKGVEGVDESQFEDVKKELDKATKEGRL